MIDPQRQDNGNQDESHDDEVHGADSGHDLGEPIDQELLENILNQTLSAEPDSNLFKVIVRFAERNRDRKITQPEVAEALVDEILQHRFSNIPMPPGCSEWVANSLLTDPDARDRIKKLWANAIGQANAN